MLGFVDIGYGQQHNAPPEVMRISELLHAHFTQNPGRNRRSRDRLFCNQTLSCWRLVRFLYVFWRTWSGWRCGKNRTRVLLHIGSHVRAYIRHFNTGRPLLKSRDIWKMPPVNPCRKISPVHLRNGQTSISAFLSGVISRYCRWHPVKHWTRLLDDPVVARYLHRLDEKTAWIKMKDSPIVEERLRALEILPSHSMDHAKDLVNSLRWDGEYLVSRTPLPSLYVIGTMQLIAETVKAHQSLFNWALTPESVRDAVTSGWKLLDILKTVETMTGQSFISGVGKEAQSVGQILR